MRPGHKILVSDGDQKHTLGIVRALGALGYEIGVFSTVRRSLCGYSRYVSREHKLPEYEAENFFKALIDIINMHDYDVLFPVGSDAFSFVVHHASQIKNHCRAKFLTPSVTAFEIAMSKERTSLFAAQNTTPCPQTFAPSSFQEVRKYSDTASYPVVIKAKREMGINVVDYAHNKPELLQKFYKQVQTYSFSQEDLPIIQEYIEGSAQGFFALAVDGDILQVFQHRRIRELPPTGGMSTCAISMCDAVVMGEGIKLLRALKWTGVAMAEFKVTKDGKPYLLEINPKFWGSLDLALESGVNFPKLVIDVLDGKKLAYNDSYELNLKFQWPMHGDLQHALVKPRNALAVMSDLLNPNVKNNLWWRRDTSGTIGIFPNLARKVLKWLRSKL